MSSSSVAVDRSAIDAAVAALVRGDLVAFPTETVYGLGADATSAAAVAKIYQAKSRPVDHPLIVHIGQRGDLDRFGADVSSEAAMLADAFWPGPLTIIVERGSEIAPETTGGRNTVGVRMPDHPVALAMIQAFAAVGSGAVAGPSANRFGGVSPTTAAHVADDLAGTVEVILDGGPSRVGVESTIVDLSTGRPELLRPGGISSVELEAVLGRPVVDGRSGPARASGMLVSHYAPAAEVQVVTASELAMVELGQGDGVVTPDRGIDGDTDNGAEGICGDNHWRLPADAGGYAALLYATLRDADRLGVSRLYVVPPPSGSLRDAVIDRLGKAAAPKPTAPSGGA